MTTQELHLGLDLELQKINSQATKDLLPQEKDWFLNKEVLKFIHQRINPLSNAKATGFENNVKRLEDLKGLVKKRPCIVETNNEGQKYITLPFNCFFPIRFDARLAKNCSNTQIIPTNKTVYITKFKLNFPLTGTLNTFSISITQNGTTTEVFNITDLPTGYLVNDEFRKQQFLLIKALKIQLLEKFKGMLNSSTQLYWERIGYEYEQDTFYLVSDIEYTSITTSINATDVTTNVSSTILNEYSVNDTPLESRMRIISEEWALDVSNSHLSKPTIQSPVIRLVQNVGEIDKIKKGAIFGTINVTYICRPILIDLLLNSNISLERKVVEKIISNTVKFIKALIHDNNYQTYAQENILTE